MEFWTFSGHLQLFEVLHTRFIDFWCCLSEYHCLKEQNLGKWNHNLVEEHYLDSLLQETSADEIDWESRSFFKPGVKS